MFDCLSLSLYSLIPHPTTLKQFNLPKCPAVKEPMKGQEIFAENKKKSIGIPPLFQAFFPIFYVKRAAFSLAPTSRV